MKNMIGKILLVVLIAVIAVILGVILYLLCISTGKMKECDEPNSIAEKSKIEINGVMNGMFIRGKSLDNPILLFISSGPGTPDYFLNEEYQDMNLEDYYTVCYWEYRGTGMVYDKDMNPDTITTEQMLDDALQMTEYLKERFHKEKIYLMGFSGGTHIGIQMAKEYPQNYYAYIAMAQVITAGEDNDTLMYDFMKDVFLKRQDKRRLAKLEKSVEKQENGKIICKDWPSYVALLHEAGGGTIKDKTEFEGIVLPILKCHSYTMKEKFDYVKGMKMYRKTPFYQDTKKQDYRKSIQQIDIPIYFISGSYDYNCPWTLVKEYYETIEAPKKDFYLIDQAAHSPLWENPKETVPILKNIKEELQ